MESDNVLVEDMNNIFVDLADSSSTSHLQEVPMDDELNDVRLNQHLFSLQDNSHVSNHHQFQEVTNEQEPEFKISNTSNLKIEGLEKENQPETLQTEEEENEEQVQQQPQRVDESPPKELEENQQSTSSSSSGLVDMNTAIFQCQFCTDKHDIKNLHNHLRKIHRARIQYMCNICETILSHVDDLRQHLEIHQSGRDPSSIQTMHERKRKRKTQRKVANSSQRDDDSTKNKIIKRKKQKTSIKKGKIIENNSDEDEDNEEDGDDNISSFELNSNNNNNNNNNHHNQIKSTGIKNDDENELQTSLQQQEGMDNNNQDNNNDDDWLTNFNDDHTTSPLGGNDDWGWDTDMLAPDIDSTNMLNPTSILLNTSTLSTPSKTTTTTTIVKEDDNKNTIKDATVLQLCGSSNNNNMKQDLKIGSTGFCCTYTGCREVFKTNEFLSIHERYHIATVVMDFLCSKCRKYFNTVQQWKNHKKYRFCKINKKRVLCRTCSHTCRSQRELNYHMQTHTGIKLFKCLEEGCGRDFTTQKAVVRHHRLIHAPPTEKPFVCSECNKAFADELDLKHHFRYHLDKNRYSCKICKKKFFLKSHLNVHMRRHLNDRPFKCPVANCDRSFVTNPERTKHVRSHANSRGAQATRLPGPGSNIILPTIQNEDGTSLFKCETCNKIFNCRDSYRKHQKIHDPTRQPLSCDTCGKKYWAKHSLKFHQLSHEDDSLKKYPCKYCPKKFMTQNLMRGHEKKHEYRASHPGNCVCHICGKALSTAVSLRTHMERHQEGKNYICTQCGFACKTKGDLKFHEYKHLEIPPFKCEFCNYRCTHPSNVNHHVDLEHTRVVDGQFVFIESKTEEKRLEEAQNTGEEIDPTTLIAKNFICDICSTMWSTEKNLQHHQLYHKEERAYMCKKCKQKFVSKYDLWIHQKQHRAPKPENVSCKICGKYCTSRPGLESHMRYNHTGETPFKCPECPREFKSNPDLKYHLVTHTGNYRFCCQVCGKRAITKGNFNAHMKTHDKSYAEKIGTRKLHTCPVEGCPVTFRSKLLLKQHLLNHQIKGELPAQNIDPELEENQNVESENHQSQMTSTTTSATTSNQEDAQHNEWIPNNNNWTQP